MSTWTNIPDATIETGKPIKAITGRALRDNTIAVAEGATGAPKIQTDALGSQVVTTAKIAPGAVSDGKLSTTVTTAGTDWVLARTAAGAAGAVGTYAFLRRGETAIAANSFGSTAPGSELAPTNAEGDLLGTVPGTWRCMGATRNENLPNRVRATLWLRIS